MNGSPAQNFNNVMQPAGILFLIFEVMLKNQHVYFFSLRFLVFLNRAELGFCYRKTRFVVLTSNYNKQRAIRSKDQKISNAT